MKYTAKQLATILGVAPSTIGRQIGRGMVSAEKGEGGGWLIDAAEAMRAYPDRLTVDDGGNLSATPVVQTDAIADATPATPAATVLQAEVAHLRDKLALIEAMRGEERRLLSERIEELREDRDAWKEQAERQTRLLADLRQSAPAPEPAEATPPPATRGRFARALAIMTGRA